MPEFDVNFQTRMLATAVREPLFLALYSETLRPNIFQSAYHRDIAGWIIDFYRKHKTPPNVVSLKHIIKENVPATSPLAEGYKILIDRMYSADLSDSSYIQEQIVTAAKYLACKNALLSMVEPLERYEFEDMRKMLDDAMKVGAGAGDVGLELTKDMATAVLKFTSMEYAVDTGFKELQQAVGGFYTGEETIVVAPPNIGKTALLGNLAYGAARHDNPVIYYTLEIGAERMLCRFYAKMAALATKDLATNISYIRAKLRQFNMTTQGTVYVKFFPARMSSVDMLRNHLSMVKGQGINPKLIIVDYADLLRPARSGAKTYEQLRETHEELRAMADEFSVHVLTASQSTRETLYAETIDLDNLAESWGKAQTADTIVALCQTIPEQTSQVARLYIAKARNETRGTTTHIATNYKHLSMRETTKAQYDEALKNHGFDSAKNKGGKKRKKGSVTLDEYYEDDR